MNEQTFSEPEWATLHEEIQQRFRALAAEIQLAAPSAYAEFSKTVTKRFPLFSNLSFSVAKPRNGNDIIVGVDIAPHDGLWRIDADICNEEDGTIFFELPNTPFSVSSYDELRERVLRATDQLIAGGKPVLLRLFGAMTLPANGAASVPELAQKL